MIKATDTDKNFWDKIAEKYARSPIADEKAYQAKLDMTREHLSADTHMLEFGCGTGSTAILHAPYVGHIDAIDLSSEMIKIAQQKAADAQIDNISFAQKDIADLPADSAQYDVILGLSVLHLLRDHRAALGKIATLLKPGGVFISSTPCMAEMGFWRILLPVMQKLGKAPYLSIFSSAQLAADQEAAGLEMLHQWRPKKRAAIFMIAKKP